MVDVGSSLPRIDAAEVNDHLKRFELWFVTKQKAHGMEGSDLTSIEHAILRAYIAWLHEVGASDAQDQAG